MLADACASGVVDIQDFLVGERTVVKLDLINYALEHVTIAGIVVLSKLQRECVEPKYLS